MRRSIEADYGAGVQGGQLIQHGKTHAADKALKEELHVANKSREFWGKVKDEDALYKNLAFSTVLEQQKRKIAENKRASLPEKVRAAHFRTGFEDFYLKQLIQDST